LLRVAPLAVALLVLFVGSAASAAGPLLTYQNWGASAYDFQNTNYDPQNVINASNVASLQINWIYQIAVNPFSIPGAPPALGIETQPLVVNGLVYIATPYNRLIALNSATSGSVWQYQVNMTKFTGKPWWAGAYIISGISYYNGTVYMMASDTTVYAFNALNGTLKWTIPDVAANIPGNTGTYYGEKAPIIVGNRIIVRASTTDYGGRGFVSAYDLTTRKSVWSWFATPPAGGNPNWDANATLGNINAYPGDWGANSLSGGGAAWGLMAVDNSTGVIYFSTGHPADPYDAALRPGPNLYSDSVVALDSQSGKMLWYYQINSHDVTEHEGGWSVTLANINVNGQNHKVVIQGAKNNYIYVLDATTGKPVYNPIYIGAPQSNVPNDGLTNSANMTLSQSAIIGNKRICPGPDGGIERSPAVVDNTLYVATQNACGIMYKGPWTYKGQTLNPGYIYTGDATATESSTLYSINLGTGKSNWTFDMTDRYQGSSAVVSGGVVYIVDRAGYLYELNQQTGNLIHKLGLGGIGAAGVSIGRSTTGEMMLFAPAGGGDLPNPTPGVLIAFGLPASAGGQSGILSLIQQPLTIALGVIVIVLAMYILLKRKKT